MKKLISKLLSLILTVATLFNVLGPATVLAVGTNNLEGKNNIKEEVKTEDSLSTKGNIEIETHLVLPIVNALKNNIMVTIYDSSSNQVSIDLNKVNEPSDGYYEENIKLGKQNIRAVVTERNKNGGLLSGVDYNENVVYLSVNLYSLDKGTYKIEFSGKHFVTYSFNVTLDHFSKRVSFTNEKGMFEIGDINADGKVDSSDNDLMLEAIRTNNLENDLNLDGVVDIADLNYITAMINGKGGMSIIEKTSAIVSDVSVDVAVSNIKEGDLNSLFIDDGGVTLQQINDAPININVDLSGKSQKNNVEMSHIKISIGDEIPKSMTVIAETEDGKKIEKEVMPQQKLNGIHLFTETDTKGSIIVDLGRQVAVKKVTIVINEASTNNLADIAKVEFLNNVKVQTKEPDNFYTPKNITVDNSISEQLTVKFDSVPNVTGYEVKIVGPKMDNVIFQTTYTSFTIEDLKNYETYNIYVQSVNQEWRSGWSDPVEAIPQATRKPPKVDNVKAVPTYSGIDFSWKKMDDTLSYKLYYRETGTIEYQVVDNITTNSYKLRGLKASTNYEAYVLGVNELGQSDSYTLVKAKTKEAGASIVPKYKLINTSSTAGKTNHILDVIYSNGEMINGDKYAMVDDDYLSYWEVKSIYASGHYDNINNPIIVLDQSYEMDEFVFTVPDSFPYNLKTGTYNQQSNQKNDTVIYYWNSSDKYTISNATKVSGVLTIKYDENNRKYYVLKLEDPIKADAIQLGLTNADNASLIQITDLKFYYYDSLVDDVARLFTDDLRLVLAEGVNQSVIDELRNRANTMDNGEYSPYRDSVLNDLNYAEKILKDEAIDDVITLNPNISNYYNSHLKFAMTISDYQPLGIVAKPGETLNVYVGTNGDVNAQIIFTQYHAEASAVVIYNFSSNNERIYIIFRC